MMGLWGIGRGLGRIGLWEGEGEGGWEDDCGIRGREGVTRGIECELLKIRHCV